MDAWKRNRLSDEKYRHIIIQIQHLSVLAVLSDDFWAHESLGRDQVRALSSQGHWFLPAEDLAPKSRPPKHHAKHTMMKVLKKD